MKKLFGILVVIILCMALFVACGPTDNKGDVGGGGGESGGGGGESGSENAVEYVIDVTDNSTWHAAKKVTLYNLGGNQVGSANISSGKATISVAEEGTYVAQIDSAPNSVSYIPALVTAKNKVGKIIVGNSSDDGEGNALYYSLGVLLNNGEPAVGYSVTICYEPDDGSIGFCLAPETTDENGAAAFANCCSGRYHVSIYTSGKFDPIMEEYTNISPTTRFFVLDINDGETDPDTPGTGSGGSTGTGGSGSETPGTGSGSGSGSDNPGTGGSGSETPGTGGSGSETPGTGGNTPGTGSGGNNPGTGTGGNTPGTGSGGSDTPGSGEHKHSYNWEITKEATCVDKGSKKGTCSCGDIVEEEIPALGHDWDESGAYKAPTCTEAGYSASAKCRTCGLTRNNETIPALGHDFDNGSVFIDVAATCSSEGRCHVYCARRNCSENISKTIPKSDHIYTSEYYIERPDCTHPGKRQMKCKFGCGNALEPEVVPALGHSWCEKEIIKKPTCTEKGERTHTCTVCGFDETYEVKELGHVYGEFVVDKAATTSNEGKMSRHCVHTGCKETTEEKSIPVVKNSDQNVEYEFRIRRTNKFSYTGFDNLKFKLYSGSSLVETIDVKSDTFKKSISSKVDKLTVEGLKEGFSTTETEYALTPGNPIVTVTVKASIIPNPNEQKPEKLMDDGDVMVDFIVRNINDADHHKENDKPLSEVIKGKKLIMFDFFWTGCTSCSAVMKIFNEMYKNELQPYRDDILVIMVDNIDYDDMYGQCSEEEQARVDRRLQNFRKNNGYSDDYVITKGFPMQWFQLEGHNVRLPGHVWMDGEGVLYKLQTLYNKEAFREMIFGVLNNYDVPDKIEEETSDEGAKVESDKTANGDVYNLIRMDKPYVYGRKFD